ncbi:MAG: lysylphosphatidylglycerol synthase transmembrane domain-containing protein [Bacteroidota bacterium]
MKKTIIQTAKFLGFLSIAVVLLYFAFRGVNIQALITDLKGARYWWIALSFVFSLLSLFSRARRWTLIIAPLNYKPSFWNTFYAVMTGYLANLAFPRIGEVTRCVTLGKKEKVPVDALIGTVIVERAFDVLMLLLLMIGLLAARAEKFGFFFKDKIFIPLGEKITGTFGAGWHFWLLISLSALLIMALLIIFRKKLYRFSLVIKIRELIKGVISGLKTVYKMKRKWEFIFHTVFIWTTYIFMTWVVVFALPATANLKFVDGLFLLVIGGLGMSAPTQGGFGAYHWITSRGLFFVYGISMEEGLAYATLSHESQTLLIILLGGFSFLMLFAGKKKIQAKTGTP